METLKRELEATKSALKLQTIRCRQLVAAFTRKLQEKEAELRASKDLRDQQLSRLLRALLILESRLKKEQKLIREQLQDKDLIIARQEKEICSLRRVEAEAEWNLEPAGEKKPRVWIQQQTKQLETTGEERLDNLCRGILDPRAGFKQKHDGQKLEVMDSAFRDNPVLESVNQILLRDEEDLLNSVKPVNETDKSLSIQKSDEGGSEWYETDSSLLVTEERTHTGAWCISVVEEEIGENVRPENRNKKEYSLWPKEKTSPTKSQHLEEKACLEMSRKTLTIAQHEDLEEVDTKSTRSLSPGKTEASYQELKPVSKNANYQPVRNSQKPPALPPKPPRLLKPYQILQQQNGVHPRHDHPASEGEQQSNGEGTGLKSARPEVKRSSSSTFGQMPTSTRHRHPPPPIKPRPKSFDGGIVTKFHAQEVKRNQMNGHVPGNVKSQEAFESAYEVVPVKTKMKEESVGAIRIGSSVSSLITGLSGDSIVTELGGNSSDKKLQVKEEEGNELSKNFEEFKLEESYMESVIEGDDIGRHDGDGAETRNNHYATLSMAAPPPPLPKDPPPSTGMDNKMYETFLETTGLSQKSILTPSRMLSNHRSCLKPKDVKHRSRIKAAAVVEKCNAAGVGGSTIKYWTEPFL